MLKPLALELRAATYLRSNRLLFRKRHALSTKSRASAETASEGQKQVQKYKENENFASRLSPAEQLRTLVASVSYGTICTVSSVGPTEGYPSGAIMPYAIDEEGRIIACLSNLSSHKRDLLTDGKATLVVQAEDFSSVADARCSLTGEFKAVPEQEKEACRTAFLKAHADAFWVDFGDFDFLRMEDVVQGNLVGSFAQVHKVPGKAYLAAKPDPVAKFSAPICKHMNEDHMDAILGIIESSSGIKAESAVMLAVDRLGIDTKAVVSTSPEGSSSPSQQQTVNVRVAFPEPAEDRKAVKDRLVALTVAARNTS